MSEQRKSLRFLMHDWLGRAGNIRISRAARSRAMPWRAVRIEIMVASEAFAIVFFRHDDGSWCVYPPTSPSLAMNPVPT
ncbi:hypothetical protein QCE49_17125 [Caballeronia sp. LZ008]|uniref:hypothetical protein n=1 Tax=unclassified Caballeronia TaxID=2646786 RepID=UPI0020283ED3|nr:MULTISPECIES: hypothetical protein [unclassified Caballeronia]MDR5795096.1 hypothetical protein [Caballeronia sp. LZ008]